MFKVALKRLRQGTISLQLQTSKNVPFTNVVEVVCLIEYV